jgi:DNA-binding response OmpR family regulator
LIVDSDAEARAVFKQALEQAGHVAVTAANGEEALEALRDSCFDLVISDICLDGTVDGLQVLKAVRWRWPKSVFIIVVAEEGTLNSALTAIDEEVDGYLLKSISPAELGEEVDDILARRRQRRVDDERGVLRWRGLEIDRERRLLTRDGQPVALTPTEYRLLSCLMLNYGCVVPSEELVRVIREGREEGEGARAQRALRWHIHRLRQKLEPDPTRPDYVRNVYGIGYVLN